MQQMTALSENVEIRAINRTDNCNLNEDVVLDASLMQTTFMCLSVAPSYGRRQASATNLLQSSTNVIADSSFQLHIVCL